MATACIISSAEDYDNLVKQTTSEKLAVIHFWAEWAPQCQQMEDVIMELMKDGSMKNIIFAKITAEDLPDITTKCAVESVPTFLFIRDGKVAAKLEGANVPEFTRTVNQQIERILPAAANIPLVKEDLNTRLHKLINSASCMLFMKGTPDNAQCGFSKQVVALLSEHNADYKSFNILSDEDVRQGLKEYSKWPTYPQLYINGELIGGIDILKELVSSGELDSLLPKREDIKTRLEKLTMKSPVMVFMKGNRDEPKCGFSRTLISILNETKIPYETFDILQDEVVRQELKTYSNWPTYPQIYVKGNLIGGLDIVKELKESGELVETLKGN